MSKKVGWLGKGIGLDSGAGLELFVLKVLGVWICSEGLGVDEQAKSKSRLTEWASRIAWDESMARLLRLRGDGPFINA